MILFQTGATPDSLWILRAGASRVERINSATGKVVASIPIAPTPESLAVGAGAVWVINQGGTILTRIDPQTNVVTARIDLSRYPGSKVGDCACHNLVVGAGAVWTFARNSTLLRIDPRTNKPTAALTFSRPVSDVAVGDGSVWVGDDEVTGVEISINRVSLRAMASP